MKSDLILLLTAAVPKTLSQFVDCTSNQVIKIQIEYILVQLVQRADYMFPLGYRILWTSEAGEWENSPGVHWAVEEVGIRLHWCFVERTGCGDCCKYSVYYFRNDICLTALNRWWSCSLRYLSTFLALFTSTPIRTILMILTRLSRVQEVCVNPNN